MDREDFLKAVVEAIRQQSPGISLDRPVDAHAKAKPGRFIHGSAPLNTQTAQNAIDTLSFDQPRLTEQAGHALLAATLNEQGQFGLGTTIESGMKTSVEAKRRGGSTHARSKVRRRRRKPNGSQISPSNDRITLSYSSLVGLRSAIMKRAADDRGKCVAEQAVAQATAALTDPGEARELLARAEPASALTLAHLGIALLVLLPGQQLIMGLDLTSPLHLSTNSSSEVGQKPIRAPSVEKSTSTRPPSIANALALADGRIVATASADFLQDHRLARHLAEVLIQMHCVHDVGTSRGVGETLDDCEHTLTTSPHAAVACPVEDLFDANEGEWGTSAERSGISDAAGQHSRSGAASAACKEGEAIAIAGAPSAGWTGLMSCLEAIAVRPEPHVRCTGVDGLLHLARAVSRQIVEMKDGVRTESINLSTRAFRGIELALVEGSSPLGHVSAHFREAIDCMLEFLDASDTFASDDAVDLVARSALAEPHVSCVQAAAALAEATLSQLGDQDLRVNVIADWVNAKDIGQASILKGAPAATATGLSRTDASKWTLATGLALARLVLRAPAGSEDLVHLSKIARAVCSIAVGMDIPVSLIPEVVAVHQCMRSTSDSAASAVGVDATVSSRYEVEVCCWDLICDGNPGHAVALDSPAGTKCADTGPSLVQLVSRLSLACSLCREHSDQVQEHIGSVISTGQSSSGNWDDIRSEGRAAGAVGGASETVTGAETTLAEADMGAASGRIQTAGVGDLISTSRILRVRVRAMQMVFMDICSQVRAVGYPGVFCAKGQVDLLEQVVASIAECGKVAGRAAAGNTMTSTMLLEAETDSDSLHERKGDSAQDSDSPVPVSSRGENHSSHPHSKGTGLVRRKVAVTQDTLELEAAANAAAGSAALDHGSDRLSRQARDGLSAAGRVSSDLAAVARGMRAIQVGARLVRGLGRSRSVATTRHSAASRDDVDGGAGPKPTHVVAGTAAFASPRKLD